MPERIVWQKLKLDYITSIGLAAAAAVTQQLAKLCHFLPLC